MIFKSVFLVSKGKKLINCNHCELKVNRFLDYPKYCSATSSKRWLNRRTEVVFIYLSMHSCLVNSFIGNSGCFGIQTTTITFCARKRSQCYSKSILSRKKKVKYLVVNGQKLNLDG